MRMKTVFKIPSRIGKFFLWFVFSFFVMSSSYSQQIPNAGQELRKQQQQKSFKSLPTIIPDVASPVEEIKKKSKNETTIHVKKFILTGEIAVFYRQQLYALLDEHIGKKMTLSELFEVIDQLTLYYRSRDYMLAKALLLPQDITEGVITIEIQEGKLDEDQNGVIINNKGDRLNVDFVKKIFNQAVKPGSVIRTDKLERGVLLINDLPGVTTSVNLEPGSMIGTTRAVLDVTEDSLFNSKIAWDNTGSRLTGAYKGSIQTDINNLSGYGDQISAIYQGSLDGGAFHYTNISSTIPIGYSGLKLGGSFQYLAYEAGKEFKDIDSKGDAYQWGINAEYPLIRSRKTNLWMQGGFIQKILSDETLGTSTNHKFLNIGSLGLVATHVDNYWGGGYTQGSLTAFYGANDLTGLQSSFQADQSATGAHTDGNFAKLSFNLRRIQKGTDDFNLIANISGQIASKNLSSSEKFQLGGATGVRAYPSGEASGDHGVLINIDGIYTLIRNTWFGDINFIGFYDWGRIQQFENSDNLILSSPNNYNLSGYGFGLKAGIPGRFDINLTVARRIGNNPAKDIVTGKDSDGSLDETRFWFSTSLLF